jgi:hypothetical protein
MIALDGLQRRVSYEDLAALARTYRDRRDGYYYNVIVELDRLLYSPDGKSPHEPKVELELIE